MIFVSPRGGSRSARSTRPTAQDSSGSSVESGSVLRLRLSTKRAYDRFRRWVSRIVWARWLLGFLFWELSGDLSFMPWGTLSETAWDVEEEYPGSKQYLEDFLLGLAIHIRYRYTLESSIEFASEIRPEFDEFIGKV